jgi:transposase
LLFNKGWASPSIAEALGCAPATAVRVVHRFLDEGEAGLQDGRRDNGCPKVDPDLLEALREQVQATPEDYGWTRPTWTREVLAKTLSRQTGVLVSVSTVARMLNRLGARWGMAAAGIAVGWSKRRKSRRVKKILKVVRNLPPDEVAYYEDEVDLHLNPRIGRDWMLRGQQKVILTPGKNQKRHIAGALAVDGTDLVFVHSKRKNTDLFLALLEKLHRHHPKARRIHLVLDNYVIHSSKRTQGYLKQCPALFEFHFLPPYSPRYNKIERFWRELHANVTRNHRCHTINQLLTKAVSYLNRVARKRRSMKKPSAVTRHTLRRAA